MAQSVAPQSRRPPLVTDGKSSGPSQKVGARPEGRAGWLDSGGRPREGVPKRPLPGTLPLTLPSRRLGESQGESGRFGNSRKDNDLRAFA